MCTKLAKHKTIFKKYKILNKTIRDQVARRTGNITKTVKYQFTANS